MALEIGSERKQDAVVVDFAGSHSVGLEIELVLKLQHCILRRSEIQPRCEPERIAFAPGLSRFVFTSSILNTPVKMES